MDQRYPWDPTTMFISELMEGSNRPMLYHSPGRQGVGEGKPELNFVLQLVRFFDHAINTVSETRVLYCGSHANVALEVIRYFPTLQLTICVASEITQWEQYRGWIVIYDYYINYRDVLIASLAKRGLGINDDTGTYVTSYRQAVEEAMVGHREAVAAFIGQQQAVNAALDPVLGLWRFTLPWHVSEVVHMDGELWPSIWGAANTSYAWLVTGLHHISKEGVVPKIYHVPAFRALLKYYNVTLRSRFYQNPLSNDGQPPSYPGLDNSWDSWATVYVLGLLSENSANELIRTWAPPTKGSANTAVNDPFM